MTAGESLSRRRLLALACVSSVGGLAGCGEGPSGSAAPGGDGGGVVERLEVAPAPSSGTVTVSLLVRDERGIESVRLSSSVDEASHRYDGQESVELTDELRVPEGREATVVVEVVDADGDRVEVERSSYARAHDRLDDRSWDVGVTYRPFGPGRGCSPGEPAHGRDGDASSLADAHLDQLAGHGARRLVWRFRRGDGADAQDRVLDSALSGDVTVQFVYDLEEGFNAGTIASDLDGLRSRLESLDAADVATVDGSPVVTIAGVFHLGGDGQTAAGLAGVVRNELGGFDEFAAELRSRLTVRGAEPYLVAQTGMGFARPELGSVEYLDWLETFDAVTPAFWADGLGTAGYVEAMGRLQAVYRHQWTWATEHGLDFVPVVPAGYDDGGDDCSGGEDATVIRRDPATFRRALAVATEYATAGRLTVESFNDWRRGTQIEAGSMRGDRYGTAYLEQVAAVQRAPAVDGERSVHHVDPAGDDSAEGGPDSPLRTIGHAIFRAGPGDTVQVQPGRYHEIVETVRPGEPGSPITITGPREAVFVGGDMTRVPEPMKIFHSHVHLTGLTVDGLQDPDNPEDPDSYAGSGVAVNPFSTGSRDRFPGYVRDVKVMPHAIGNVQGNMINTKFANDVEIGEFEVIGPGGVKHLHGDAEGHNGEVVYIGTPSTKFREDRDQEVVVQGADIDESHGYHVHHIDNSAGHPHAELVDVKHGAYDVTIEYCTDAGGAARYALSDDSPPWTEAAVNLGGANNILRWCVIEGSHGSGVRIGNFSGSLDVFPPLPEERFPGTGNAIYGNTVTGAASLALVFPSEMYTSETLQNGPGEQRTICGNETDGETLGTPGQACATGIPTTDTIGYLGGDSPWA